MKRSRRRTSVSGLLLRFFLLSLFIATVIVALRSRPLAQSSSYCTSDTIRINEGTFIYGNRAEMVNYLFDLCEDLIGDCDENWFAREYPPKKVFLPAFCIDKYEYPNEEGRLPQTSVTWKRAHDLCAAKGKRLCSAKEWERACAGPQNRVWPYGSKHQEHACNEGGDNLDPSGARQSCRTPEGVYDMSGNVAEWTASTDDMEYASLDDDSTPRHVKGGAYMDYPLFTRCSFRDTYTPDYDYQHFGFRCCMTPKN